MMRFMSDVVVLAECGLVHVLHSISGIACLAYAR